MPRPRALPGADAARGTLVHRKTALADRLRQLYVRFGLRARRVFLVWTEWSGRERGEGDERVLARVELLPTPRIADASSIVRRPSAVGVLGDGSLRIDQISAGAYTEDNLRGLVIPSASAAAPRGSVGTPVEGTRVDPRSNRAIDFFFEVVEDGRGDDPAARRRYRLASGPWRNEGALYWALNVEAADLALDRHGTPRTGAEDF